MNRIIAEAGSNHNGNKETAKQLVDIAAIAGATSVKFQFIFPAGLYLPQARIDGNIVRSEVYKVREREQLSYEEWKEVWQHAKSIGINISASVFCEDGINLLTSLGSDYVKIASTDLSNLSLISMACQNFKKVIVSTGMATIDEIAHTVSMVKNNYPDVELALMHCVSIYPCKFEQSQISRISALSKVFDVEVGYSDHTNDATSAILAWSMGARLFEKHFTYDQSASGFDHAHAQDRIGLSNYVELLGKCGDAVAWNPFSLDSDQQITKVRARRGVYAAHNLQAGHVLSSEDLLFVRPSTHSDVTDVSQLIGCKLESAVEKHAPLGLSSGARVVETNWGKAQSYWSNEMKSKKMD